MSVAAAAAAAPAATRHIIFGAPSLSAIIDLRKTQTRRLLKLPPGGEFDGHGPDGVRWSYPDAETGSRLTRCPYGSPGRHQLWVREAWRTAKLLDDLTPKQIAERAAAAGCEPPWAPIEYEADGRRDNWDAAIWSAEAGRYRNARYMPRWASRLTLEITDVRVQRLQDISREDAEAEGARFLDGGRDRYGQRRTCWSLREPHPVAVDPHNGWEHCMGTPRMAFANAWNLMHDKARTKASANLRWDANPRVWAITFRRFDHG